MADPLCTSVYGWVHGGRGNADRCAGCDPGQAWRLQVVPAGSCGVNPVPYVPTSAVLGEMFQSEEGSAEYVTLDWLMRGLGDRSFGIVLLLLALLAALAPIAFYKVRDHRRGRLRGKRPLG